MWDIYHADSECAHLMSDPLGTSVEASHDFAAEEAAARLGFNEPWAHPATYDEAQRAGTLSEHRKNCRQRTCRAHSRGIPN
jgi:hypothetical protein